MREIRAYPLLVIAPLVVLLASIDAGAKVLYVNDTLGNDSVPYASNSGSSPWKTVGRALWGSTDNSAPNGTEAAKAGDTVKVAAGTYRQGTGLARRFEPVFNPVNSGSAGAPIVIQAQGTVELIMASGTGPVMGVEGRNYIVWDGFKVVESASQNISVADTGPVTVHNSTGSQIINCEIHSYNNNRMDNHNGIRVEQSHQLLIRNNRIYDVGISANEDPANAAGIMLYYSDTVVIEHNEIYRCGAGIWPKATNNDITVRFNLIVDCIDGICVGGALGPGFHHVYQNVVRGSWSAIKIQCDTTLTTFANNTLDRNDNGIYPWCSNNWSRVAWRNNIITRSLTAINAEGLASLTATLGDYDLASTYTNFGSLSWVKYATRAAWVSLTGQETNSLTSDPLYVNPGANDYHLQASSPARNAGIDILDLNANSSTTDRITMGAYITGTEVIGVDSGSADTTPPTAPTSLTPTAASDTQINLGWTAASDTSGGVTYFVERCQGTACTNFSQIRTTSSTNYSDTALTASTSYNYRVRAQDAAGNLGPFSNTAQATTAAPPPPDTTAPAAPTSLTATPLSSAQVKLGWTAATDNVGVTSYHVERCSGSGCTAFSEIGTLAGTTYTDTGLTASTSYSYRVRAQDAAGNLGPFSNTAQAVTLAPPPPGAGLAASWGFNEGSGTLTTDSSGNGNTGTLSDSTSWVTSAKHGAGLSLDGSGKSVQIPNSSSLDIAGTQITVSFWVWVDPSTTSDSVILEKPWTAGSQSSPFYQFGVEFGSSAKTADFYFATTGGVPNGPFSMPMTIGTWAHITFTYDGLMVRGYRDGTQVVSTAAGGSLVARSNAQQIGVDAAGRQAFKGQLDDVRIYSRVLSDAEIQSDMNAPVGGLLDATPPATVVSLRRTDARP